MSIMVIQTSEEATMMIQSVENKLIKYVCIVVDKRNLITAFEIPNYISFCLY